MLYKYSCTDWNWFRLLFYTTAAWMVTLVDFLLDGSRAETCENVSGWCWVNWSAASPCGGLSSVNQRWTLPGWFLLTSSSSSLRRMSFSVWRGKQQSSSDQLRRERSCKPTAQSWPGWQIWASTWCCHPDPPWSCGLTAAWEWCLQRRPKQRKQVVFWCVCVFFFLSCVKQYWTCSTSDHSNMLKLAHFGLGLLICSDGEAACEEREAERLFYFPVELHWHLLGTAALVSVLWPHLIHRFARTPAARWVPWSQ